MPSSPEKAQRARLLRWSLLALLGTVLLMLVGAFTWFNRVEVLRLLEESRLAFLVWLRTVPLPVYILAFVVLPALGLPLTLFYLTVGPVVGGIVPSLLVAWICVMGNMALSYALARGFLEPLIDRLVRRRGLQVPSVTPADEWKLILMLRSSPIPWVFQNYLLALAGARFWPYLLLSIVVQGAIGAGMIIVGASLFTGQAKYALLGIFLFFAASFIISRLRRRAEPETAHGTPPV